MPNVRIEVLAALAGLIGAVTVWFVLSLIANVRALRERATDKNQPAEAPEQEEP